MGPVAMNQEARMAAHDHDADARELVFAASAPGEAHEHPDTVVVRLQ